MKAVNSAEFRKNMKANLDAVEEDYETLILKRTANSKGVVMLSMEEYNSIMETLHLLSTNANREALKRSLDQFSSGDTIKAEL